jgi:hypothetical protein
LLFLQDYANVYIMSNPESLTLPTPDAEREQQAPDFEYRLLVGHQRTDGSWKSSEDLKTEYVHLTDDLVNKITNGVEVADPDTGEVTKKPVDYVVYLDKSARPVQWLTHELWSTLAQDETGNVPKEPGYKFANIDRNQWTSTIDPEGQGVTNVQDVDPSVVRSLRSVFLAKPQDRADGLTDHIDTAPTQFDGKTVLIVDEVRSTGRTLDYATQFFARAFPEATVAGTHWMGKTTMKNGAIGNADLPVWYSDKTELGRGVADRNVDLSLSRGGEGKMWAKGSSPSEDDSTRAKESYTTNRNMSVQRLGAWFLSTRLQGSDALSTQLRAEIHQLGQDVRDRKVVVEPSFQRTEDDFEWRALELNGFGSLREYVDARNDRIKRSAEDNR